MTAAAVIELIIEPIIEKAAPVVKRGPSTERAGGAVRCEPSPVVHALMPSVVRFMLHEFLAIDATEVAVAGGEGWLPTPENVNALPEGIRRYIHDLETRCDPVGDVQKMALQADTIRGLDAKVRELEARLASVRREGERGQ
jgi:hypothetical protein